MGYAIMLFKKKNNADDLALAMNIQKEAEEQVKKIQDLMEKDTIQKKMVSQSPHREPVPLPPEKFKASKIYEITKHDKFKWKHKMMIRFWPEETFLVEMIFSNGTTKEFIVRAKGETFTYKGKEYYLRFEDAYFDLNHKQNKLLFHEDFTVPLRKEIIKEKDPNNPKLFHPLFEVHPSALKNLLDMEYIKQLTTDDLSKYLKMSLLLSAITLLLMVFIGYLWARSQGLF